jgi:mono/diheme cytochrome c family protein
MSADPRKVNLRAEAAGASDESIQAVHDGLLHQQVEPKEGFTLMPLFLLGVLSTMIFIVSVYFIHNRGGFDPLTHDGRFDPKTMGASAVAAAPADPRIAGKRFYTQVCATCHQATGLGVPGVYPPLAGSEWVTTNDSRLIRLVVHGLQGPITVEGKTYNGVMPAFGAGSSYNWNDQRISDVLTYIRSEWGNTAAPITPEQVTAIRTGVDAGRTKAWTEAELLAAP